MFKKLSPFKSKRGNEQPDGDDRDAGPMPHGEASPPVRRGTDGGPCRKSDGRIVDSDPDGRSGGTGFDPKDDVPGTQVLDDGPEFAGEMPDEESDPFSAPVLPGDAGNRAKDDDITRPIRAQPVIQAHPAVVCRLYSQDYGNSFRIFDESIPGALKQELLECIYDSLFINDDGVHPIAVRRGDVVLSGWMLTADVLSDRYNTDAVGRSKLPMFAGVTRPASADILIPRLEILRSIYEDGIGGIWTTGGLNTHPPSVPFVLRPEDSLEITGKGKVKVRSGLTMFMGHIPEKDMENLSKTDSWILILDVRDEKQARSMGATHCTIGDGIIKENGRNER